MNDESHGLKRYQPYNFYEELLWQIKGYKDLVPLFSENGHIRIKNKQLDFCYVPSIQTNLKVNTWPPCVEVIVSPDIVNSSTGAHLRK